MAWGEKGGHEGARVWEVVKDETEKRAFKLSLHPSAAQLLQD